MHNHAPSALIRRTVFCLIVLAIITATLSLPFLLRTEASKGLVSRTESHDAGVPNYDIRTDKTAINKLGAFRASAGQNAVAVADTRDEFVHGEAQLRQRVPTLRVEYNSDIRIPEVIAPDVKQGRAFLTAPTSAKHSDILLGFLKQNSGLMGVSGPQADGLKVRADYTNPDGNMSFVELDQEINGVPVFRGEVKAGFTKRGEMVRVVNNLAPALDYNSLSTDFGDPLTAVNAAAGFINNNGSKLDLNKNAAVSSDIKTVFGVGDWATTAEKMYFPTEPGVAVPAWRVLIWQPVNAYYVIVDANTGTMLWRKNITEDQTQSATYNVWANPNAMINVADNPFPMTPGPTSPNGQQGAALARTLISRIGNEAPYTFNNNGWITDGGTETDGNANEAGLDRDTTNGVDTTNGRAVSASRTFDFPYAPFNPNTLTGDSPTPAGEAITPCSSIVQPHGMNDAQRAAVTQLFYINNWYHDETYRLGFTEAAGNFQASNFGRGGVEGDRVSAEAQDCSGTNNANFATAADGVRGRMQMYIWTGPPVDADGDVDADIVIHEHTHGLSNRLHGNGSGLSTNMSRGMGEGWSDFYAHSLLSEPTDPINGIYATGGYATYNIVTGFVNNYYYGIRRYPKAVLAFTGGANNKPHNAFTFKFVNSDCNNFLNNTNFAYARGPVGSTTCDQVHNLGEIWSSALWEVRARLVTRLGWAVGNRKMLQLVTDGMKLAPLGPTMLQERDAIVAAAQANSSAPDAALDVSDMWTGFAARGMGYTASIQNAGTGVGDTAVTEAFDLPNLLQTPNFTFSDAPGNNNGFAEPGEALTLTIPLSNNTGNTASNTTLQVVGGGNANYGTIANASTVTQNASFVVPPGTPCGSLLTLTFNVNSGLGATSFTRSIFVGVPTVTLSQNFDGVTAPAIPAGWTASSALGGLNFVTVTTNADTAPNSVYALDPSAAAGEADLTSPSFPVSSPAATVSFRHRYDTESAWDGGVLEISVGGGAFADIVTAGGSFVSNGYNGTMTAATSSGTYTANPLNGRNGWTGNSGGFITTVVRLPASANGQNVQLKWRFGADDNGVGVGPNPGWYVDTVQVVGSYSCPGTLSKARADFDGDKKTDVSVFRPSEGNWYLNQSTAGFVGLHFGNPTDIPTPGDFDGDGKTDIAVFRPSEGNWYRLNSSDGQFVAIHFGMAGDVPQAGDFDGDGKDDIAVWRPSTGTWYWLNSSNGQFNAAQFGQTGDLPVAGDYDGDHKDDIAVYRPSGGIWYWMNSGNGQFNAVSFGLSTDLPTPADYDGDGRQDISVFRPSDGNWYRLNSSDGQFVAIHFGTSGDVPVPGDYDGDGKYDQAVYRGGIWYMNQSTAGFAAASFGLATDIPIPKEYIP